MHVRFTAVWHNSYSQKGYFNKLNDVITKTQFFYGFEQEIMFYGVERLLEVNL